MFDVVALGELLIDFTQNGLSAQGNPLFEANPGGAPSNMLAMLAKLGKNTAFIGKVGRDLFGDMLRDTLRAVHVGDQGLMVDETANTTLAFVHTKPGGDREFSFYRKPGADMLLSEADLDQALVTDCTIFHFGTVSCTHEGVRNATFAAARMAKAAGRLVSFDPNLRPPLWDDLEEARASMDQGCRLCDILKIADNEALFLSGKADLEAAAQWLRAEYPGRLILLTMGKEGSAGFLGDVAVRAPGFRVDTIETTGAGDCFMGCCLGYILDHGLQGLDEAGLARMLRFANAAAALVTTKKGAIRSMPGRDEILRLMEETAER